MLRLACFALLVAVASAGKIQFSNCGSVGELVSLDVQGCTAAPCELKKGQAYQIESVFQPKSASDSLIVNVVGKVSIITVPIVEKDACEGLSTGCPYQGGVLNNHKIVINISQELIETEARVELKLRNKEGAVEACFAAQVKIVA